MTKRDLRERGLTLFAMGNHSTRGDADRAARAQLDREQRARDMHQLQQHGAAVSWANVPGPDLSGLPNWTQ